MTTSEWRSLERNSLYLKSTFTATSYDVWATDLSRLWHESMKTDEITRRASENGLAIDLEETGNLKVMLERLSSSLQSDKIQVTKSRSGAFLELEATIKLPKPLEEVSWVFEPGRCHEEEFKQHVTIPLFEKIRVHERAEADLIQRIRDKDHVIERILDNIDKVGVDLAVVFPALAPHASKTGVTKHDAETHIPALTRFDASKWRDDIRRGHVYRGIEAVDHADLKPGPILGDDITESENEIEHSVKSLLVASTPTSSLKKKIGGREASLTPLVESPKLRDSPHTNEARPKGLKKTLRGKKKSPTPIVEISESPEAEKSQEPLKRGLKRTIGGRHAPRLDVQARSPISAHTAEEEKQAEEEAEAAELLANEKRKAVRRELEQKIAPRAKKRRF